MRVTLSVWCEACCTCSRKGKAKERYLAARKQGRSSVPVALPLAPERSSRTATRPRAFQHGTLDIEWQCTELCPVRSPPSGSVRRTATRPRAFQCGTLDIEWQCTELCLVRSPPSGSVRRTATRPPAFQHGTLDIEWQCTARCPVRSPPSVSVRRTATRPPAFRSHCHSAPSVPARYAHRRVAVYGALPLAPERSILYVHPRLAV